jgi:hypothetical protein
MTYRNMNMAPVPGIFRKIGTFVNLAFSTRYKSHKFPESGFMSLPSDRRANNFGFGWSIDFGVLSPAIGGTWVPISCVTCSAVLPSYMPAYQPRFFLFFMVFEVLSGDSYSAPVLPLL